MRWPLLTNVSVPLKTTSHMKHTHSVSTSAHFDHGGKMTACILVFLQRISFVLSAILKYWCFVYNFDDAYLLPLIELQYHEYI